MHPDWIDNAVFYHIYPLGLLGAPARNDFSAAPVDRLAALDGWLDHSQSLGANALYLGPLFESSAHGYDTADYTHVDRRLGDAAALQRLSRSIKARGMRLVLDGVFHHVGRNFWAFRDLLAHGEGSAYRDWFQNVDFSRRSPYGDPFAYEGWAGHYDLVKLNTGHPDVRRHLFDAITGWVERFDIDGLRLDVADAIDHDFLRALAAHCRALKPDFWLMGEVVHGDYRRWANPDMLDATTNYEAYKGLYSSHVDANFFEIAYALNRQSGRDGLYRDLRLYNFADNHDVDRVASRLTDPAHLYTLYGLLFTMPGVPSIYYGSEWGLTGQRTPASDAALRPALDLADAQAHAAQPDLPAAIARFAALRRALVALRCGGYRELHVAAQQLAFAREATGQTVVVALNAAAAPASVRVHGLGATTLRDCLDPGEPVALHHGEASIPVPPHWLRVLVAEEG